MAGVKLIGNCKMKTRFKGVLLKKIDPSAAPALGLNRAFALPPNQEEVASFIESEVAVRWVALDEIFRLDSTAVNIDEQRAKALIEYNTGIKSDDPLWFKHVAAFLARRHVPGFAILNSGSNRHGAPVGWTGQRQAELIADICVDMRLMGNWTMSDCRNWRFQFTVSMFSNSTPMI